jgi:hypothetical protein
MPVPNYPPFDLKRLQVYPLAGRKSLSRVEDVLRDPDSPPPAASADIDSWMRECVSSLVQARQKGASIMLIYGAHLLRNGAALILERMMAGGWITALATNGAGSIHDWEYAFLGRSTESVKENVATGTFGTWDETGRNFQLALQAGALRGEGYGKSLGRFIAEDGIELPVPQALAESLRAEPGHPLAAARAELLHTMNELGLAGGRITVPHPWSRASILAHAFRLGVQATIHPGIGYDIITNHPLFNGGAIGRAAQLDFCQFAGAVEQLAGGVVFSIGSAIMGPQVFEKSVSCVNNLRLQQGCPILSGHTIYVVDLQEGGHWDWSQGEPPKSNADYYLRFCKSYSRMGGAMRYFCCDNITFLRHLYHHLKKL